MKPLADVVLTALKATGDSETENGGWNGATFEKAGMPMVVSCTGCGMTMTSLSPTAQVDDEDYIWCKECADH